MADLLTDLFDPQADPQGLTLKRARSLNKATARPRLLARLRADTLDSSRVDVACAILYALDPTRMATALGELAVDPAVPPFNRAAAALVLYRADIDADVPVAGLPVLAESLFLAITLVEDIEQFAPVLAAMLASESVDADALIARIERWRTALVAPGDVVYGDVLRSRACASRHQRVLTVLERDPDVDTMVAAAVKRHSLDRSLVADFQGRAAHPAGGLQARAWVGPRCAGGVGRLVALLVRGGDGTATLLSARLSEQRCGDAEIVPLASSSEAAAVEARFDAEPSLIEVPPGSLTTAAALCTGRGADDRRVLWMLRRFLPAAHGFRAYLVSAFIADLPWVRAALAGLASDTEGMATETAARLLIDAVLAGTYSPEATRFDSDREPWDRLFTDVVAALEALPLRRAKSDTNVLSWAWGEISEALRLAEAELGLLPSVRASISSDRLDRLVWREVAASWVEDEHEAHDTPTDDLHLGDAIVDHVKILGRLGHTPADLARALGSPAALGEKIAALLGIAPDAPLASAELYRDVDDHFDDAWDDVWDESWDGEEER